MWASTTSTISASPCRTEMSDRRGRRRQRVASSSEITYDMANDVWWRFRESGGMVNFETSADNSTWNARRAPVATPSWIFYVRPDLIAAGSGMPGMAQFAQLDTTLAPVPCARPRRCTTRFRRMTRNGERRAGTPQPTCTLGFANDATITFPMPATCYVGTSYASGISPTAHSRSDGHRRPLRPRCSCRWSKASRATPRRPVCS